MRILRLLLIVVLLTTACRNDQASTATDQTAPTFEVRATGFLFNPDEIDVSAGATVTWTNDDDILHTVTSGTPESPTEGFDRDLDGEDTSTSIEFTEPGVYRYFCSRHPHMTGVITVHEPSP